MTDVGMPVDMNRAARQAATVDQAGVIEGITENGVFALRQGADESEVGGEAAAEDERRLGAFPGR